MLTTASFSFGIDVKPDRERVVVALTGELDLSTVPQAQAALEELLGVGFPHVTVDLRRLTFIDSAGLRLLVRTAAAARERDATLRLIQGPEPVRRAFALTGLDAGFAFEDR